MLGLHRRKRNCGDKRVVRNVFGVLETKFISFSNSPLPTRLNTYGYPQTPQMVFLQNGQVCQPRAARSSRRAEPVNKNSSCSSWLTNRILTTQDSNSNVQQLIEALRGDATRCCSTKHRLQHMTKQ